MMRVAMMKMTFLVLCLAMPVAVGCGGDSAARPDADSAATGTDTNDTAEEGDGTVLDVGEEVAVRDDAVDVDVIIPARASVTVYVTSSAGDAVANSTVTVAGASAVTDATGKATFDAVPAGAPVVVTARTLGFVATHAVLTPAADVINYQALAVPVTTSLEVTPGASVTVVSVAGFELALPPAGTFLRPDGSAHSGAIEIRVGDLNDSMRNTPLPLVDDGNGGMGTPLTVLAFELSVKAAGSEVALQPASTVGVALPLALTESLAIDIAAGQLIIELQAFDEATGIWARVGNLDWQDGVARIALPHFTRFAGVVQVPPFLGGGTRVATAVFDTGCVCGRVVRGSDPVAQAVVLYSFWTGSRSSSIDGGSSVTTPVDGKFCVQTKREGAYATISWPGGGASDPANPGNGVSIRDDFKIDGQLVSITARATADGDPTNPASCRDIGDVQHPVTAVAPSCAGNAALCDDLNPCTTDSCDATTACANMAACSGCSHAVRVGTCDDQNACTINDACGAGAATATNPTGAMCQGTVISCPDDGDACTDEVCSPISGACDALAHCRHDPSAMCSSGACSCAPWATPTTPPGGSVAVCAPIPVLAATCRAVDALACPFSTPAGCLDLLGGLRAEKGGMCASQFDAVLTCVNAGINATTPTAGCSTREPGGWELAFPSPCQAELDLHELCVEGPCVDADGDGWGVGAGNGCLLGGGDCDDFNLDVRPGRDEICDDLVDNDCDNDTDSADSDCP